MSVTPVVADAASGVVEVPAGDLDWAAGPDVVSQLLADHYEAEHASGARETPPGGADGVMLPAPADYAGLRIALRAAIPALGELADRVAATFDAGACAVVIPALGLADAPLDRRRASVFALASVLGNVTPTDPEDRRVVWDVRNAGAAARHSSFSQNDREAEYHTDSAMLPVPEHFFLLYAVRQANCGGGVSFLRDVRQLRDALAITERGRAALRVLGEVEIPMRVPKAFRPHFAGMPSYRSGYHYAPLLTDGPLVRWRKDKVESALASDADYITNEVRDAVALFTEHLEDPAQEIRRTIPEDGMLIVNNHVALHGRTSFTDPERHLFRIRFHATG
jgi:alpha-ketoglutarate-dependent taurine dioxygenase